MRIGMDFGTTNSGIAACDQSDLRILTLDPHTEREVMRSVLYLTREGEVHVGQRAIDLYNQQNINRARRFVQKRVGHIEMEFSEIGVVETDVYITVDELEPGRLMRSLKSALATPYTGTRIFEREYTLEELIALYLGAARQRACDLLGCEVDSVVLGRPVHFVGAETPEDDAHAEGRLRKAAQLAGFKTIDFAFEPIAAARSYARRVTEPQNILVYDFGGGTLDITAMHLSPKQKPQVLAIGGVGIAGDRFDQRIVEGALLPHFGAGITWGEKNLPLPKSLIEQITEWEGLPALATIETRGFLHRVQAKCSAPARIYALESLIFSFYGFALMEAVEASKRHLSDAYFTAFTFEGKDIQVWQPITRAQFEQYSAAEWRKIRAAVLDVLEQSGLRATQIQAVVQTGGSSSIPMSLAILGEIFGQEKLLVEDRFAGVTAGLGLIAAEMA